MNRLGTTKLSSKGQVIIPEEIRNQLKLLPGQQFIVMAEKDVVVLKTITPPNKNEHKALISKARQTAKQLGLTKDRIEEAIKEARKI